MSKFSGVCDLYDHISMEKMYPLYPGNEHSPSVSDEMECFKIFKEKTQGVMYQHQLLELTELNIDEEIKKRNNKEILSKIPHTEIVEDKRYKGGTREITWYSYIYYGKEYQTLKELNKKHYYTEITIHFDELIDIIPYYPYVIAACACGQGRESIILASESEVDNNQLLYLKHGIPSDGVTQQRHDLQKHYIDVVQRYYSPTYDGTQKYLN